MRVFPIMVTALLITGNLLLGAALFSGALVPSGHIGQSELIIVPVIIFILFGHRLPSLMRNLGNGPPGGFC